MKDSEWLAELRRHGLVKPSFIPPATIREMREVTRSRTSLVHQRRPEVNRLHRTLRGDR